MEESGRTARRSAGGQGRVSPHAKRDTVHGRRGPSGGIQAGPGVGDLDQKQGMVLQLDEATGSALRYPGRFVY